MNTDTTSPTQPAIQPRTRSVSLFHCDNSSAYGWILKSRSDWIKPDPVRQKPIRPDQSRAKPLRLDHVDPRRRTPQRTAAGTHKYTPAAGFLIPKSAAYFPSGLSSGRNVCGTLVWPGMHTCAPVAGRPTTKARPRLIFCSNRRGICRAQGYPIT